MSNSEPAPRQPAYPIEPFFLERWSPRSLLPDPISDEDWFTILEAARWAPSSYNNQPWRFLYTRHGSETWPLFFNLLAEANQSWVKHASILVVIISNTQFDHNGKESPTHSFDAGAAFENLSLQAWLKGYIAHGMQGFDYGRAQTELEIPSEFKRGSHGRPRPARTQRSVAEPAARAGDAQPAAFPRRKRGGG